MYYCFTNVLASNVTEPFLANALPYKTAPVSKVIDSKEMFVPLNEVVVPKVAELLTCQKMLEA
jgi:chitodextrinase